MGEHHSGTAATESSNESPRYSHLTANKASATQNSMSIETMQLVNHKFLCDSPSPNRLQHVPSDNTFECTKKSCSAQASQKFLDYGVMQCAAHPYRNQALYRKLALGPYSSVNTDKTFTPRANKQLTIFYAGSVHVFDNVPLLTLQTILLMASKASNTTIKVVNTNSGASVPPSFKGLVTNRQILTQALNDTNHSAYSCSSISANNNGVIISPSLSDNDPSKNVNSFVKTNKVGTSMFRVVPQARKESLARFLRKRKERLRNKSCVDQGDSLTLYKDLA
ncbi:protein TIFY 7-like isoform X2 [Phalaenopsis equestris]|uniref:protein TIFY 7-like isoform X2 n=1 Tax=Phalaenopsis equestris TaxID=78828 RepID=UPI0009E1C650|nr:protein TIFY 7-like isoform X2 [Phalaenopsis equestris]